LRAASKVLIFEHITIMRRILLLVLCVGYTCISITAQNNRSIDGFSNNLANPEWGSTDVNLLRIVPSAYGDGLATLAGQDRPNPRFISNELFSQLDLLNDPMELSNFIWVFGQLMDHDIGLTSNEPNEFAMIPVPMGDPSFDPFNTGMVMIPMRRSTFDPNTGTSSPRQHINEITTFLDGSCVYGSDQETADWLRSFQDGKLKMSSGNLLPFNTLDNERDGELDNAAPHMDDEVGFSPTLFVAGDARANENLLLIGLHTLFAREHNRVCDELKLSNPTFTDEQLYQKARKIVSGIIQHICFDEWLPAMGIELPAYAGYKSDVNPGLSNIFTGAAFRLGHTLLTSDIMRLDNDGQEISAGNLKLQEAFFQPYRVVDEGGIDPLFKGMAQQIQQDFDCKVVDDVRNFLFGPPGAGGLDLVSININRGRERGFPDYNTVRTALGLGTVTAWDEINTDPNFATLMESTYGDINTIDPWVGFLAEEHMPSALFGPTLMHIMHDQFLRLRDGDRFYYQNDTGLTLSERQSIASTNMADVVRRNTGVTIMQGNLFKSLSHENVANCNALVSNADLNISIRNPAGTKIQNTDLKFINGATQFQEQINNIANGEFVLNNLLTCYDYDLAVSKEGSYRGGVSTYDIILIQSQLLQLNDYFISNPYLQLAGDVDNNNRLDVNDMLVIRQFLLGFIDEFPAVEPWQFYPGDIDFLDPSDPFTTDFTSNLAIALLNDNRDILFTGVKAGDVSGNAQVNLSPVAEPRTAANISFKTGASNFKKGEIVSIPIYSDAMEALAGFQFTLDFHTEYLRFENMTSGSLSNFSAANYRHDENLGTVTTSWTGKISAKNIAPLFYLNFTAQQDGNIANYISFTPHVLVSEAYTQSAEIADLSLDFDGVVTQTTTSFEVSAARPNPFKYNTTIDIKMPTDGFMELLITDNFGRQVYTQNAQLTAGINTLTISPENIGTTGTYFYQINTAHGIKHGQLIYIQ